MIGAEAGFLKVSIARPALVGWLHAAPTAACRWDDWSRRIWHVDGAARGAIFDDRTLADAATVAARSAINHDLLLHLIGGAAAPSIAAFDNNGVFLAGTMCCSARPGNILAFLALARSLTDHLDRDGHAIAVVRNHGWSHGDAEATIDALLVRPFGEQRDQIRIPVIAETRH
ncbi:hypothetical protein [Sphingomonas kyungheensis]|uniref:Uncharacterized protein n=1 Tax=Sphingomonas kyungheensis TaxID=1069987 RepID=A0ABU8H0B8_9SPHN